MKVVVCTERRGVFFGELAGERADDPLELKDAQMCVYWSRDVRGVVGLAATGPTADCRVSKPAPSMTLKGITAVMEASPEAIAAWEAQPWS